MCRSDLRLILYLLCTISFYIRKSHLADKLFSFSYNVSRIRNFGQKFCSSVLKQFSYASDVVFNNIKAVDCVLLYGMKNLAVATEFVDSEGVSAMVYNTRDY
jgi:hypothetical protein